MLSTYLKQYKAYLKLEKNLSENTIESYIRDINKFSQYYDEIKNEKLVFATITYEDLQDFIKWVSEIGLGVSSQARLISGLKSFFKFLLLENIIDKNPANLLLAPKLGRKLPDTLSIEEIDDLIAAIDRSKAEGERNIAILETLYGCGLRVSELINLKLSEIFWDEGFIRVIGKGDKQRLVPFGNKVYKHLQIYINEVRNHQTIASGHEDYVFLNRRGKQLTRVMIFTIIKQLAEKINLNKSISPHTFRHSFATHLVEGGANLRAVQEMLGHESITTTEIYTHLDTKFLQSEILHYHPWANK